MTLKISNVKNSQEIKASNRVFDFRGNLENITSSNMLDPEFKKKIAIFQGGPVTETNEADKRIGTGEK